MFAMNAISRPSGGFSFMMVETRSGVCAKTCSLSGSRRSFISFMHIRMSGQQSGICILRRCFFPSGAEPGFSIRIRFSA